MRVQRCVRHVTYLTHNLPSLSHLVPPPLKEDLLLPLFHKIVETSLPPPLQRLEGGVRNYERINISLTDMWSLRVDFQISNDFRLKELTLVRYHKKGQKTGDLMKLSKNAEISKILNILIYTKF